MALILSLAHDFGVDHRDSYHHSMREIEGARRALLLDARWRRRAPRPLGIVVKMTVTTFNVCGRRRRSYHHWHSEGVERLLKRQRGPRPSYTHFLLW